MPSPVRFLPFVLFIPLFLVACTPQQKITPSAARYALVIKNAVQMNMYNASAYKGKVCTIHMMLRRDGTVEKATAENGDPELCNAALTAVKNANIPPAPDEKTWQVFRNAPLDFSY